MVDNRRVPRPRPIVYQRFALRFEDDEDGKMEDAFLAELVTLQVSGLKAAALCITVICALWMVSMQKRKPDVLYTQDGSPLEMEPLMRRGVTMLGTNRLTWC